MGFRWIGADEAEALATELLSPERSQPIVAVTSKRAAGGATIDPAELAEALGSAAEVVALETGDPTWALSEALPSRLDVYDGAARIWWPGLTADSEPYDHPLLFIHNERGARIAFSRVIAAIIGRDERAGRWGQWSPEVDPEDVAPEDVAPEAESSAPELVAAVHAIVPIHRPGETTKTGKFVHAATVTRIQGKVIEVRVDNRESIVAFADETLESLASRLSVGQEIPAFVASTKEGGVPLFSTQGLISVPASTSAALKPRGRAPGRASPTARILDGVVLEIDGDRIKVEAGGERGVVTDADAPLAKVAAELKEGDALPVRRRASPRWSSPEFSIRGIGVDPWPRIAEAYRVNDIVRARVCSIEDKYIMVELLPGAAVRVWIGEMDWTFVEHPSKVVCLGERVNVKILSLYLGRHQGTASMKQAYMADVSGPLPALSPGLGQPPFLADDPEAVVAPEPDDASAALADDLSQELEQVVADRAELVKQLRMTKKELRSTEDRIRLMETRASGDLDPIASDTNFLTAVRVEYARRMNESDRLEYPLSRMRVGSGFLDRLRGLQGISVEKVVEVCAQVACERAHEVPAREVHLLRAGVGGSASRVRSHDEAKAWRCSLQDNTASARRLHWWDIPGEGGRTIEFASVAVHDDFTIPE